MGNFKDIFKTYEILRNEYLIVSNSTQRTEYIPSHTNKCSTAAPSTYLCSNYIIQNYFKVIFYNILKNYNSFVKENFSIVLNHFKTKLFLWCTIILLIISSGGDIIRPGSYN